MSKRRRRREPSDGLPEGLIMALRVLGVLVLVVLIIGGAWFLSSLGPERSTYRPAFIPEQEIPTALADKLQRSLDLETAFEEIEKQRAITAEDLPALREALALQLEYVRETGHDNAEARRRATKLRTWLDNYTTEPMYARSREIQARADAEEIARRPLAAIELLRQAIAIQKEINQEFPLSKFRDENRVALMDRQISYLLAMPLDLERAAAEEAARDAIRREDWTVALQKFQEAYDLQTRLNVEFPNQPFVNIGNQNLLKGELASLQSLGLHRQVQESVAAGRAANAAGEYARAGEQFQNAYRIQLKLNETFKDSRFASVKTLDEVEGEWQTALSRPVAAQILRQADTLVTLLRERKVAEARELVSRLTLSATQFRTNFPRSPLLDQALQQRVEYVNFKRDELGPLQEQVLQSLIAVPGSPDVRLYKQEVTQALYNAVIGSRPSSNLGDRLPVDSVSWAEAQQFCQQLSWLLGRKVRLPTIEEYRAALGDTAQLDVAAVTWNMDNSGGRTQNVASKTATGAGYYDLLGNVGEWLERPADMDPALAPIAGGHAQTDIVAIRDVPVASVRAVDRSRFTGFRFVVEQSAPPARAAP